MSKLQLPTDEATWKFLMTYLKIYHRTFGGTAEIIIPLNDVPYIKRTYV